MISVIIVFPKPEDGKSIRNLLARHGYDVAAVCTQGAQVLNYADMVNGGIVISGYKFPDMYYFDLKNSLPPDFDYAAAGFSEGLRRVPRSGYYTGVHAA